MKKAEVKTDEQKRILKELQIIPGVGKSIALDLWNIGVRGVADLHGKNPARLYQKLNKFSGVTQDICLLYVFRCAVYFATERKLKKEKLEWWYWKDKEYNGG